MNSKTFTYLTLVLMCCSCSASKSNNQLLFSKLEPLREVTFYGSCDASGAVVLSQELFAVADDEDNVLRIYNAVDGGNPIMQRDVSYFNQLKIDSKSSHRPTPAPLDEMDIEAATMLNGKALWITSHGRDSKGREAPDRLRFFATTFDMKHKNVNLTEPAVTNLIDQLDKLDALKSYHLKEAANKPPKGVGGLSIEGMTATPDGELVLGLRNPTPNGHALIFVVKNPNEVLSGQAPLVETAHLLNLNGRGIRGISYWKNRYIIAAGDPGDEFNPALYTWDGITESVQALSLSLPHNFNIEAFFTPENRNEFLILSDDGNMEVNGKRCKKLKNANIKAFRGLWLKPVPTQ